MGCSDRLYRLFRWCRRYSLLRRIHSQNPHTRYKPHGRYDDETYRTCVRTGVLRSFRFGRQGCESPNQLAGCNVIQEIGLRLISLPKRSWPRPEAQAESGVPGSCVGHIPTECRSGFSVRLQWACSPLRRSPPLRPLCPRPQESRFQNRPCGRPVPNPPHEHRLRQSLLQKKGLSRRPLLPKGRPRMVIPPCNVNCAGCIRKAAAKPLKFRHPRNCNAPTVGQRSPSRWHRSRHPCQCTERMPSRQLGPVRLLPPVPRRGQPIGIRSCRSSSELCRAPSRPIGPRHLRRQLDPRRLPPRWRIRHHRPPLRRGRMLLTMVPNPSVLPSNPHGLPR